MNIDIDIDLSIKIHPLNCTCVLRMYIHTYTPSLSSYIFSLSSSSSLLDGVATATSHHSISEPSSSSSSVRGFWGGYHVVRPAMMQALTTSSTTPSHIHICINTMPPCRIHYPPPIYTLLPLSYILPPVSTIT